MYQVVCDACAWERELIFDLSLVKIEGNIEEVKKLP
jgi:hypothetical protein